MHAELLKRTEPQPDKPELFTIHQLGVASIEAQEAAASLFLPCDDVQTRSV